jgi:hypothetical protein
MTALPDPDRQPDPRERRPNRRRAVDSESKRQRDLGPTWTKRQAAAVARDTKRKGHP